MTGRAAAAVEDGTAHAYASVARAHVGFLAQNPDLSLAVSTVPTEEKAPAYGSFAVAKDDHDFFVR